MSLFSHAMTFLQRRTSRAPALGQPDSRRRRERALRAASSLDLEGSNSDLELESSNTSNEPVCNMQNEPVDMNPCGALQAHLAVELDLAPTLVCLSPTLQLDVQKRSSTPNDSQPKLFFAVAQRARAETYIDEAPQEQAHSSVPSPVSKPVLYPTLKNDQLWEATPGRQNMAQDVDNYELTHLDTVIVQESKEDLAAATAHADAIRSEAMPCRTSQQVPLPASQITSNLGASSSNEEEDRSGHAGRSLGAVPPESNEIEPAITEEHCQDAIDRKVHVEVSMSEAVPSYIHLPASPEVSCLDLSAKPCIGHEWETTSGQQQMRRDDMNAVLAETEVCIVMDKCKDIKGQQVDAEEFIGQAPQLRAFSPLASPASEGASNHERFAGLNDETTPGHPKVVQNDVQAEPTDPDAVFGEEHCEVLVLPNATAEEPSGEGVPIEASMTALSSLLELNVEPEHPSGHEWHSASGKQQMVQDDVQAKPTEPASPIVGEQFEESAAVKSCVEASGGEAARKRTPRHMASSAAEIPLNHDPFSGTERDAMSRQPRMAQDTVQAELTRNAPAMVEEGGERTTVQKAHVEVSRGAAAPIQSSLCASSPVSDIILNAEPCVCHEQEAMQLQPTMVQDDVNAEPTEPESSFTKESFAEVFTGQAVPVQISLRAPSPVSELRWNAAPSSDDRRKATSGHRVMARDDALAEPTEPVSAIQWKPCEHILAEKAHAKAVHGEAMRELFSLAATSPIPVSALNHKPSSTQGQLATASRIGMAQDDFHADPEEVQPGVMEEQCNDEKSRGQKKWSCGRSTEGCLQETPHASQSFSRVTSHRDKRQARLLRAASSLGPCSNAETGFPSPCKTESDLEQEDDKDSDPVGSATLHRTESAMLQKGSTSKENQSLAVLTSNQSQVNDQEKSVLAAMALDSSRPEDQTNLTSEEAAKASCENSVRMFQSSIMVPVTKGSFLSTKSQLAALAQLGNQYDSASADPSLVRMGLVPELSQVGEYELNALASVATESEDKKAREMTEAEAESDEDCAQQTRQCQHHVGDCNHQLKDHLENVVDDGQEQGETEPGVDEEQAGGEGGDKQEEVAESREVKLEVVGGPLECRMQLEPSVQRAPQVGSPPRSSPNGNNRFGCEHHQRAVTAWSSSENEAETNSGESERIGKAMSPQQHEALGTICKRVLPCHAVPLQQQNPLAGRMQRSTFDCTELPAAALLCSPDMQREPLGIGGIVPRGKDPAEVALALKEGAHSQTIVEVNAASHANPAPTSISTSSAKRMSDSDKLQQSIPKLMQVANAKRRLVGKQPIEEQPRKLQKQLGSHPPFRSGSEIVRSCLGHFLQPSEQGCTIRVLGDGWGGLGEGYLATVTEADASSFTVIRQGGHWEETHVLRGYCDLIPQPELQLEHSHLGSSQSQAKRLRKSE